jgi:hypothetical protein
MAAGSTARDVRSGSWLCKNAKTLKHDRRSYPSETALVAQLASEFNLEVELKNIILVALRFFEFLHSQGHSHRSGGAAFTSVLPDNRTSSASVGMSQRCQQETHAPQQQHRYSITSSARASSAGGTVRPRALAVLRLMTNLYVDACSTGKSAGLAPLRILSM